MRTRISWICVLTFVLITSLHVFVPANGEKESTSNYGTIKIDNDSFSIKEDQLVIMQITGKVVNASGGVRLSLFIDKPGGSTAEVKTLPNNLGEYSTSLLLDANWQVGNYSMRAVYLGNQIGTVTFVINEIEGPNIVTTQTIGTLNIEKEEYFISKNGTTVVEIYGNIIEYKEDTPIIFIIKKPDGTTQDFAVKGERTGDFKTRITIKDDWASGTYEISGSYEDKPLGNGSFVVNNLESSESVIQIPQWIKTNAGWWASNQIQDNDFVKGIEYLIKQNILKIPQTTQEESETESQQIPSWLRKNAGWWSEGSLSNDEFVKGIQYLIQKNIIKISQNTRMQITSSAFTNNGSIPSKYTCDGEDISPPLSFVNIPKNAKSIALIMDDPDAPVGTFVHWVVWNISPDKTTISEGEKLPAIQGRTDFGKIGYGGPCPPSGTHRYFFKLYALDNILGLTEGSTKQDLEKAMINHIIDQAKLIGKYSRN